MIINPKKKDEIIFFLKKTDISLFFIKKQLKFFLNSIMLFLKGFFS